MIPHTDISQDDWVDIQLPAWARPYARLMRLDRPIGTWLLMWPCWWGAALAAQTIPDFWHLMLFGFGALIMRGAGCAINDIYDRHLDKKVVRTKSRPLASGKLGLWHAILFTVLLLVIGLAVLVQFNSFTVWLGLLSLVLVFTYPLAKRVTWWPQLVLGLAFNWGALMGWAAARGTLELPALLLYVGGVFWTLGYDTIYAHQDKHDDQLLGIKSLALYLGSKSRSWIAGFYAASMALIAAAGAMVGMGLPFYLFLIIPLGHALWQIKTWRMDDPANCLQRFRSNRHFGLLIFFALIAGRLL